MKDHLVRLLIAVLLLAVSCGGTIPDSVINQIDDTVGCVAIRPVDTLRACDLSNGGLIVVHPMGQAEAEHAVDVDKANGQSGPWIVGDGFVIAFSADAAEHAAEVLAVVGGELRT